MTNKLQNFNNIPAEIRDSRRFFLVAENKRPLQKDWSNPAVQKSYTEIDGLCGFDTCGHNVGDDFLFLDFDHVLNAEGDFVNETVEDFFGELVLTFKNMYVEKSISGTGLHVFLKPTPNKFEGITNSEDGVYHFDGGTDKNSPKLELFYGSGGRYCLVTGNLFDCDDGEELIIPSGAEVDEYFSKLLADIQKQLQNRGIMKSARIEENIFADTEEIVKHVAGVDTPAEYRHDLCITLFDYLDGANLERGDWLPIITALKAEGFTQGEVKAMCQSSSRYNEKNFDKEWQSLTDIAGYGVSTLIGKARGFDFKGYYRQWYKEHPQYQKAKFDSTENKLAADERAFAEEKQAAIEYIKNLEIFDTATVTSSETLKSSAFAKIFDFQAFSSFMEGVKNQPKHKQVNLNDLKAALKPFVEEITSRRDKLKKRRATFDADKKSAAFITKNDLTEKFKTPYDYEISADGISKFLPTGDSVKICRQPLIISEKIYSLENKTFTVKVAYKSNNKWCYSPAVDLETISNHRKFTELSNYNVPVTSANSYSLVEYLDAFRAENENAIPVTCTVKNCGWLKVNGKEIFVDPRRELTITDSSGNVRPLKVEDSAFAQNLKTAGSLKEWRRVYNLAKEYSVARFVVAACVAAPLLKILNERNFLIYILSNTTSGKTTALSLGTSAVGNVDGLLRNLDATANGIAGVAAEYNHYSLPLDENEVADSRLKESAKKIVYALANGVSRTKLNSDSTVKELKNWKTIAILTGESELLEDNVTAGAYTRLMTIKATPPVLPAELCEDLRNTFFTNYGHALPLVIDEIFNTGFDKLRELFKGIAKQLTEKFPSVLPEYCRYVALVTVADILLNTALNQNDNYSAQSDIHAGAITNATTILKLVPKKAEISDAAREQDMISDFISANLNCFVGATGIDIKQMRAFYGKFETDGFIYITASAVNIACKTEGFKKKKVVADLIQNSFWEKDSPKIAGKTTRSYKISKSKIGVAEDAGEK